jgi:hypothetical protein
MDKSWKIVVIMSNDFTKSEWCQWEVDLIQERRRRYGKDTLVLIMYRQIDTSHMTNSVRAEDYEGYSYKKIVKISFDVNMSGVNSYV